MNISRNTTIAVLSLYRTGWARRILFSVRMVVKALKHRENIPANEVVCDREIQTVNHCLLKQSSSWRNAYMNARHEYHE